MRDGCCAAWPVAPRPAAPAALLDDDGAEFRDEAAWPVAPRVPAPAVLLDGNRKPVTDIELCVPMASAGLTAHSESPQEEAAWPVAPPSADHFFVTLVKRPQETSFGLRFRERAEGAQLESVTARSPAARWNDEHCVDEVLLRGDVLVRADCDFRSASTRKVRLLVWRPVPFEEAVLAFNTALMDEHVPEVPPESKRQMRKVVEECTDTETFV